MALTFPYTSRSFIRFRHSDTGLTPTFSYFKQADSLVNLTAPVIHEVGGGTYYFDYEFASPSDPDIVFEIDGGASIPTEEVRYVSDTISINDRFLDEPVSQVVSDVWGDMGTQELGTKGRFVVDLGVPTFGDTSSEPIHTIAKGLQNIRNTIGDPLNGPTLVDEIQASTSDTAANILAARHDIKGPDDISLSDLSTDTIAQTASVNANVDSAETAILNAVAGVANSAAAVPADLVARLDYLRDSTQRVLGLTKENSVLKNTFFDTQGNLIQGDFFIYPDAASAQAGAGELAKYRITAQWDGQKVQNYSMVKQP